MSWVGARIRAAERRLVAGIVGLRVDLGVLRRGIGLILAAGPATAAALVVVFLLLNVLPVVQVWLTKVVVDQLVILAATPVLPGAGLAVVVPVLVPAALYALTLLVPIFQPLQLALVLGLQDRAAAEIDRGLIGAGTRLVDLNRIERGAFQEEFGLLNEASAVPREFLDFLRGGLAAAVTAGGVLFLLARLHPLIPLALLAAGVPRAIVAQRVYRLMDDARRRRSRSVLEADYFLHIAGDPTAAKEVRVFGLGDFLLRRFRERGDATVREIDQLHLHALGRFVAAGGLEVVALLGSFWYVATQTSAGRLGLGDLALYLAAVAQLHQHLVTLATSFGTGYKAFLSLRRLFAFHDEARPGIALPPPGSGRLVPATLQSGIRLHHLRFRYPEGTRDVLQDVTAILPAGKITALVGENGAGKTALVISHRLSTVRTADHILVLQGGRVTEAGSHDTLLARGGHYATLFEMQARRYR